MRFCFVLILLFSLSSFAQIKEFDNLEMLYDQGHYRKVLRKSNRLLDRPEFDFSLVPAFYKSLSTLQLYKDENFRRRNPNALNEATTLFEKVKREDQGGKLFTAHYYEVQSLKKDLQSFAEGLKQQGDLALHATVNTTIKTVFAGIVGLDELESIVQVVKPKEIKAVKGISDVRMQVVEYAQSFVGTPYRPGGLDPQGFDCSGFTTYVMKAFDQDIPRRASDQQKDAAKVRVKDAKPGDLVFFDSGSGVNHVGIVVVNQSGSIKMVHASTSQGIVVTDIESSAYWNKRLHSVGTVFTD
jgi:cell wall-associated NlpC family hydrolase